MSRSFGLPQSTLDEMRAIFARHNKVTKVVVYGSRAKGNYRNGSDIDLTMFGKDLTFQDLSTIHNALDDSSNPYLVNLSIYNHLDNAKLREHIDRVGQVFYQNPSAVMWKQSKAWCDAKCESSTDGERIQTKEISLEDGEYVVIWTANGINRQLFKQKIKPVYYHAEPSNLLTV